MNAESGQTVETLTQLKAYLDGWYDQDPDAEIDPVPGDGEVVAHVETWDGRLVNELTGAGFRVEQADADAPIRVFAFVSETDYTQGESP